MGSSCSKNQILWFVPWISTSVCQWCSALIDRFFNSDDWSCHFNSFFLTMVEKVKRSYMIFICLQSNHSKDEIQAHFIISADNQQSAFKWEIGNSEVGGGLSRWVLLQFSFGFTRLSTRLLSVFVFEIPRAYRTLILSC